LLNTIVPVKPESELESWLIFGQKDWILNTLERSRVGVIVGSFVGVVVGTFEDSNVGLASKVGELTGVAFCGAHPDTNTRTSIVSRVLCGFNVTRFLASNKISFFINHIDRIATGYSSHNDSEI
jgi:hypothetical protein